MMTLDRGVHQRTRVPRTRPYPPRASTPLGPCVQAHPRNRRNVKFVTLLLIFTFACVACFGSAYYLFRTRWGTLPDHLRALYADSAPFEANTSICDDNTHGRRAPIDPNERFLAYLPHSGFNNQRIAFENALVLSRILNRTLIVPPVRLGDKPVPYFPLDRLSRTLALAEKNGLGHCAHVPPGLSTPPECSDYFDFSHIPWDWLIDLSLVKSKQKLLCRWSFAEGWFNDILGISENQTFLMRDHNLYHYRFVDNVGSSNRNNGYLEDVSIDALVQRKQKLLFFGSLFGSARLQFHREEHLEMRREIREAMLIAHPILNRISTSISKALGDAYLAIHLRASESKFERASETNSREIWWTLIHQFLNLTLDDTSRLEKIIQNNERGVTAMEHNRLNSPNRVPLNDTERSALDIASRSVCPRSQMYASAQSLLGNNPPLLYIATDLRDTRNHPLLLRFRAFFPCTFDLSNFSSHLTLLNQLVNPVDGLPLRRHFLPFVDALIASKAVRVAGTRGSTFSYYIEDILWRRNHDLPIKQRGTF